MVKEFPRPDYIEIVDQKNSFFAIRYTDDGDFCGDSWHQNLQQAKQQAKFEFELTEDEWETIEK
ncbi:hypothetical protein ACFL02_08355 [Planctomycetota bacterium]